MNDGKKYQLITRMPPPIQYIEINILFDENDMTSLDINVVSAWENWISYGIHGGSFAMSVMYNDHKLAEMTAHELIKSDIDSYFKWCNTRVPDMCRSPKWWGFEHMTKEQEMFLKLKCSNDHQVMRWYKKWLERKY